MTRAASRLRVGLIFTLAAAICLPGGAETRFVLPFSGALPGAYGSQWVTRTTLLYSGNEPITISPPPLCFAGECPFSILLPPGLGPLPVVNYGAPAEGTLVTVSDDGRNLVLKSRVRDLTRSGDGEGTEVPVPREGEFRTTPLRLLDLPLSQNGRANVRIYTLPEFAGGEIEIRYFLSPVFDPSSGGYDAEVRLLTTETLALQPRHAGGGYAPMVLVNGIELKPGLVSAENVWIEIVPLRIGMPIYAFASITNNQTQSVTIVTP